MNFLLKNKLNLETQMLLDLNEFILNGSKFKDYHIQHISLVRKYAMILNKKLGANLSDRKLNYIALSHDILKERALDPRRSEVKWNNHVIPQDTNRYVRTNLDILEEYGLDEYFNTDIQYHALSAGIFLRKELGIIDREILYPVFFHSCPIMDIYKTLDIRTRTMIDVTMLADKLSSNYLRINLKESEVRIDLDQAVFGSNGREFNYTLGLFLARLLGQDNSEEKQSVAATEYYHKRLCDMNPIISKNCCNIKSLGGKKKWPKRKSQVLQMH